MSRLMVPAAAVAAAAAIVTAGCASAGASGPGSLDGAAAIAPANAVAFVAASTDLGSSRWHGIGKRFMTQFQSLAPAFGTEIDVAVLPTKEVVAFTQPQDGAKLAALATKHGEKTRVIGGWTAIAKTDAALGTVANATAHLADSSVRRGDEPAAERRPRARVRERAGGTATDRVDPRRARDVTRTGSRALPLEHKNPAKVNVATINFRWVAAAVTSTSDGLKVEVFTRTNGLTAAGAPRYIVHPTPPYVPALLDEIPSGALAVVDLQATQGMFENLQQLPAPLVSALRREERCCATAAARHAARRRDGDLRSAVPAGAGGDTRHAAHRHGCSVVDARRGARRVAVDEHVLGPQALPDDDRRAVRRLDDTAGARRFPRRRCEALRRSVVPRREEAVGNGRRDDGVHLRKREGCAAAGVARRR